MVPADAAGRVLLISDGNETAGRLSEAARSFRTAGVPIDVASISYDRSGHVRVENVVAPLWVREGETIPVRVVLHSGRPTSGRLTLLIDGVAVDLDPDSEGVARRMNLQSGVNVFSQQLRLPGASVHRIEATFEPDNDAGSIQSLLRGEAMTFTSTRGRILVLADNREEAYPFLESLRSEHVNLEVMHGRSAPYLVEDWSSYDAVVLFDQPASNFTRTQQVGLARAVHDSGVGLLVVGGPNSFGAGGWIGSSLEGVFPVLLEPPARRELPMGALALVIDNSGSMGMGVSGTSLSQQQIANESAILGVRTLSRLDHVTVISFDSISRLVVPLTLCADKDSIERSIRTISPSGGTNLFPAIDLAASELAKSTAGVKHIIILTDGQTMGDPQAGLRTAARLRRNGVTITTVSIGDGSNDPLLAALAQEGGGRYHPVTSEDSRAQLPQIFVKEAQTVRRSLIWEGAGFSPELSVVGESLVGFVGPFPSVTGYVVTADRGGLATVALRGPEGDPLLAHWQHGLGRVTAYTSDATTRWNSAWRGWGSFDAFWRQQLSWVTRPSSDANVTVNVDVRGERALVSLDMLDSVGERVNFAAIRGRLLLPAGSRSDGADVARDVTFRQVGPGRYESEVELSRVGSHLLSMRYEALSRREEGEVVLSGNVRAAIVRPGGEEFRRESPNLGLLREVAALTEGREYLLDPAGTDLWGREHLKMPEISRPMWLLAALLACGVFLLDVAARRVSIDYGRMRAGVTGLLKTSPRVSGGTLSTLAGAKERAGASIRGRGESTERRETDVIERLDRFEDSSGSAAAAGVKPDPISALASDVHSPKGDGAAGKAGDERDSDGGDVMSRLQAAKKRSQRDITRGPDAL